MLLSEYQKKVWMKSIQDEIKTLTLSFSGLHFQLGSNIELLKSHVIWKIDKII